MIKSLSIFALVATLFVTPALAGTVSYSHTVTPTTTSVSETWNCPRFDTALGTLDSVNVYVDWSHGRFCGQESECEDTGALGISYDMPASMSVTFGGATLASQSNNQSTALYSYGPYDGVTDFDGPSGAYLRTYYNAISSNTYTDSATKSAFTGAGVIALNLSETASGSYALTSFACSGAYSVAQRYKLFGTYTVTYSYH